MKKSHIGEKFNFEKCGPYEIIEDLGYFKGKLKVRIKFLNTGTIKEAQYDNVKNGKVKDHAKFMYDNKNKLFQSNYGSFNIIEDLGVINGSKMVKIRFALTGFENIVQYNHAKEGLVKDPTYFMYTIKDKIFLSNNYGPFKIIEDLGNINNYKRVKIKFINTKSEAVVRYDDAKNGEVSDPSFTNAYIARNIIGPVEIQNIDRALSNIYRGMMSRCYNEKDQMYSLYGEKGVTVSDEWHDFNIFKHDAQLLPGWQCKLLDPLNYHLDKDLFQFNLSHDKRIYSKDTCTWLPASMNTALNQYNIKIYYNHIYELFGYYYIKLNINGMPNYGPFNNLDSAVNMLNYLYMRLNIKNNIIDDNFKYMNIKEIMNNTPDRKSMAEIVK